MEKRGRALPIDGLLPYVVKRCNRLLGEAEGGYFFFI